MNKENIPYLANLSRNNKILNNSKIHNIMQEDYE